MTHIEFFIAFYSLGTTYIARLALHILQDSTLAKSNRCHIASGLNAAFICSLFSGVDYLLP